MEAGFFKMENVTTVTKLNSIVQARGYALEVVENFVAQHPDTRQENINKANKMILKSRNPIELGINMSNFLLAHPSEGLKTI